MLFFFFLCAANELRRREPSHWCEFLKPVGLALAGHTMNYGFIPYLLGLLLH